MTLCVASKKRVMPPYSRAILLMKPVIEFEISELIEGYCVSRVKRELIVMTSYDYLTGLHNNPERLLLVDEI